MNHFCIIGLGRFGKTLALKLNEYGKNVLAVDTSADRIDEVDEYIDGLVGDATKEEFLNGIGISNYDCAVVCFSNNINASVLTTLLLKEKGVPKVVVRASNELHKKVLEKIGADVVILPENDMGEKVAYRLAKNNVLEFIELDDKHSITEFEMPKSWIGKSAIELNVRQRYGVSIVALRSGKGDLTVSIDPNVPFKPDDKIIVIGPKENMDKISQAAK